MRFGNEFCSDCTTFHLLTQFIRAQIFIGFNLKCLYLLAAAYCDFLFDHYGADTLNIITVVAAILVFVGVYMVSKNPTTTVQKDQ